jgi:hypothetical protein
MKNKDFLYDSAPTQTLRYKNECHCLTSRCFHDTVFNYENCNIKHFIVQLMHTNYKILRLLK